MSTTLRTTASSLNVRDAAGTQSRVLLKLPAGSRVVKLEASPDGSWFRVQTPGGQTGWIAAKYAVEENEQAPAMRVTATELNLRSGPGKDQPVLAQLSFGTQVRKIGASADGAWAQVRTQAGATGWVSAKFLADVHAEPEEAHSEETFPWYRIARGEIGVQEIPGAKSNKHIEEYFGATSMGRDTTDDVAWCSAFANWCMKQAGIKGSGSAAARSWQNWGRAIQTPVEGCVAVLKRTEDPTKGHVAFFVRRAGNKVILLGGNQGNMVKEAPYDASRVITYRLPA